MGMDDPLCLFLHHTEARPVLTASLFITSYAGGSTIPVWVREAMVDAGVSLEGL